MHGRRGVHGRQGVCGARGVCMAGGGTYDTGCMCGRGRRPLQRTVRILLECILVLHYICHIAGSGTVCARPVQDRYRKNSFRDARNSNRYAIRFI